MRSIRLNMIQFSGTYPTIFVWFSFQNLLLVNAFCNAQEVYPENRIYPQVVDIFIPQADKPEIFTRQMLYIRVARNFAIKLVLFVNERICQRATITRTYIIWYSILDKNGSAIQAPRRQRRPKLIIARTLGYALITATVKRSRNRRKWPWRRTIIQ